MADPPASDAALYFTQSAAIPAPYFTDWRVVRPAEGIVRITLFERSHERLVAEGPITTVLHVRGAFTCSQQSFEVFLDFARKLLEAWKGAVEPSRANFEPPEGRMN